MKSVILNSGLITTREAARELKDYSKVIVREKIHLEYVHIEIIV